MDIFPSSYPPLKRDEANQIKLNLFAKLRVGMVIQLTIVNLYNLTNRFGLFEGTYKKGLSHSLKK